MIRARRASRITLTIEILFSPRSHEKQNFTLAPSLSKHRVCGVVYCRPRLRCRPRLQRCRPHTTTPAQHLPSHIPRGLSTTPHPLAPLPMMIDVGAREIRCGHAAPPTSRVWSRALPCVVRVWRGLHTRHGSAREHPEGPPPVAHSYAYGRGRQRDANKSVVCRRSTTTSHVTPMCETDA